MTLANCPAPTAAKRIRSSCVRAGGALLALDDAEPVTTPLHHLLDDGSFAVAVALEAGAGVAGAHAVLELADYAPLPLREPVRSLVWIRGRLHPVPLPAVRGLLDLIAAEDANPALLQVQTAASAPPAGDDPAYTLLRLAVESVVMTDTTGAEAVDVAALLAAQPDPFCAMESCRIRHLDTAHRDVIARSRPGCPRGCGAATSARWVWIATGWGCGWSAPTATTTSGCRSAGRLTMWSASTGPSGY